MDRIDYRRELQRERRRIDRLIRGSEAGQATTSAPKGTRSRGQSNPDYLSTYTLGSPVEQITNLPIGAGQVDITLQVK